MANGWTESIVVLECEVDVPFVWAGFFLVSVTFSHCGGVRRVMMRGVRGLLIS